MKEAEIQNSICDYLALRKHFFWRQNSAPSVYYKGDQMLFRAMPKYGMRGVPDIIVMGDGGKFIGLEVKNEKGKPSDDQIKFGKNCILHGGEYFIVRSIDDVQKIGL